MATLYVLQGGRAEWADERRIDSTVGVPLDAEGIEATRDMAAQLTDCDIKAVYACHGASQWQAAEIVADTLKLKPVHRSALGELDFGLWQGLLVKEVKQRYAKAYRQWRCGGGDAGPPGGETFVQAQDRVCRAAGRILKRHKGQDVLLVLEPVAASLLKCRLNACDLSDVWDRIDWTPAWRTYELDDGKAMEVQS